MNSLIRGLGIILIAGYGGLALAESCTIVNRTSAGLVNVTIDGQAYRAMSDSAFKDVKATAERNKVLEQELKEAHAKIAEYQSLTTSYETLKKQYAELTQQYQTQLAASTKLADDYKVNSENLIGQTHQYEKLVRDYDKLAGMYRDVAVAKSPTFHFDAGIGMIDNRVNNETQGSVLVGAGIYRLKAWYLWYPDGQSILVGTTFAF
jgi:hypothetical protein